MSVRWDAFTPRRSATPLYRQVASFMRGAINDGRLEPGSALPGEAQLAEYMNVSIDTIRASLKLLRDEGLIETATGIGSFIAEP